MCSDDRQEIVLLQEIACSRIREEVGATSDMIVNEVLGSLLLAEFF
jgi:hypothetical protein